jgi:hypothetical protein
VGVTSLNKNSALSATLELLHRVWPLATLAVAVLVNVLWIGALIYAVLKLF